MHEISPESQFYRVRMGRSSGCSAADGDRAAGAAGQGLVVFYGMVKPVRTPLIGPRVRGGAAKQATSGSVQATTDQASPKFVTPEAQQCASYW